MFYKNYLFMFTTLMVLGTSMVISSSSWLNVWLGIEINLLSFIPILMHKNSFKSSDTTIKYFIIQASSSVIIICSSLSTGFNHMLTNSSITSSVLLVALFIKMAVAPLHIWLPQIINNCNWPQVFLLLTWQKIGPFWVSSLIISPQFLSQAVTLSAILASLSGLMTNSIKMILTFSSVTHSSWMLTSIFMKKTLWMNYFTIYSIMNLNLIILALVLKIDSINENKISELSKLSSLALAMPLLSIAGLPPFLGFFPKLMVIQMMIISWPNLLLMLSLMLGTLIALFFYIKMMLSTSLCMTHLNKFTKQNPMMINISTISIAGNLMIPLSLNF